MTVESVIGIANPQPVTSGNRANTQEDGRMPL